MDRFLRLYALPLLLVLLWDGLLYGLYAHVAHQESDYAQELASVQIQTLHSSIINTRSWVAKHGGLWLTKAPDAQPNPRLPAATRELTSTTGIDLVKINPAGVIRKISEHSQDPNMRFHMFSESPMYRGNLPDDGETAGLKAFAKGENSLFTHEKESALFRYMTPLKAEVSCLTCHTENKVGDVLGGLSVSINTEHILAFRDDRLYTLALTFLLVGVIGTLGIGGASLQLNRKRAEAESASLAKSEFLANMSHEIRTPMNGILGLCYLVQKTPLSEGQQTLLNKIETSAKTLLRILNDILDFSKVEAQKMQIEHIPFLLMPALESTVALVLPDAEAKQLTMTLNVAPDVPGTIIGDPLRLNQVLLNLTCNAIKFTREGGVRIDVEVRSQNPTQVVLQFSVSDTGMGLSPKNIQRLFKSFSQADSSIARHHGGSGLGLAISKGLVELMGGRIDVTSTEGVGSTFSFILPFRLDAADLFQKPQAPAQPFEDLQECRILLVEDNAINQVVAAEILNSFNAVVDIAGNGREALEKIRDNPYDVVLMDIQMPIMDGLEATRILRSDPAYQSLPIIAMTANAMAEDVDKSMAAGMQAHINKPFVPEELLSTILRSRRGLCPLDSRRGLCPLDSRRGE